MPKSALSRILKVLVVVVAFACLALTLNHSAKDAMRIPAPNPAWLTLAVVLFLVHYLIQAIGWHGILRALGEPVTLRTSVRMWYMSIIARWMPGRIWYSATRLYLAREAGISLPAVAFAMVFELIYIMIGGTIASLLFAGAQMKGLLATGGGKSAFVFVALAMFIAIAIALRPRTLLRLCRFRFFRKAVRRLAGSDLSEEAMPALSTDRSLALLAYFTLFWIYSGVMFGMLASAFIPMNSTRWLVCIPAFAGSWLIGFFSIVTPAGMGAREGAMWLMLRNVMPQTLAVVLAVASRIMMMATELLSVGIVYLLLRGTVRLPMEASVPAERG